MRKSDYAILAATINRRLNDAHGLSVINPEEKRYYEGAINALENTAATFARFASVDKAEFLKACGIEP